MQRFIYLKHLFSKLTFKFFDMKKISQHFNVNRREIGD